MDDDGAHVVCTQKLVEGAYQVLGLTLAQRAAREVDVLGGEPGGDLSDGEPEAGQAALVDLDLDLLLQAAGDHHRGDALDPLERTLEVLLGREAHPPEVGAAVEPDAHDRVKRGIVAQQHRLLGVCRKIHPIEALAHIERGEVHVGSPGELESHLGDVGARRGGHADDVVDHADGILDRSRQQRLNLHRRCAFHLGAHGEGGVGDVGKEIDREVAEGDGAEDDRGEGKNKD